MGAYADVDLVGKLWPFLYDLIFVRFLFNFWFLLQFIPFLIALWIFFMIFSTPREFEHANLR